MRMALYVAELYPPFAFLDDGKIAWISIADLVEVYRWYKPERVGETPSRPQLGDGESVDQNQK
jgi:hypothetical protein